MKRILAATVAALLTMVLGAGTASAAAPVASTGGAGAITSNGAKINGTVDPNGERTTYYFEYGTTNRYGSRTPDGATGTGSNGVKVSATLSGLAPNTTYHYRLVASNPSGVDAGGDKTFKTKPQPLGLQIGATPNPVTFGSPTTITGSLTGTGNAGKQVQLQARGFPYTSAFTNLGNPVVTDANGNFAIPLLPPTVNTQYRVQTVDKPVVTSPILNLGVAVRVQTNATKTRVKRGRTVRFFGTIRPARAGAQFAVQREKAPGVWQNVAGGITRTGSTDFSRWSKRVKIRRGGNYRVFVLIIDGNYVSGIGRTVKIRSFR